MKYGRRSFIIDLLIIVLVPLVFTTTLGIYGAIRPKRLVSVAAPEHYGIEYENVSLVTEDAVQIAGWYFPSEGDPTDQAIIVLHGYPTDKGDLLARSKFLLKDYNLLLIDFRYFGQSDGSYTTIGAKEVKDLLAAVEFLKDRNMSKIGVYGISMGGAVALMGIPLAGEQINAVVSEAAYGNLAMMTREMYRYLGPLERPLTWTTVMASRLLLGIDPEHVSPAEAVRDQDTPVLLVHSREDKVISFDNALFIQDALIDNPNAEYLFFDRGNHGEVSIEFAQAMDAFFAKYLKGVPYSESDDETDVWTTEQQ
ncbi:MAG: alpha/beta fold hydrolase [Patescibacteria group bacterium]